MTPALRALVPHLLLYATLAIATVVAVIEVWRWIVSHARRGPDSLPSNPATPFSREQLRVTRREVEARASRGTYRPRGATPEGGR
jgi:hypothetical protein